MHGAPPQPPGWIGILHQGIGDDEAGETDVPQDVEPYRALQPRAEQAAWREHARKEVSIHGICISAAKRYPLEITRSARERRMENCANSKTAVIESITSIAVA